MSLAHGEFGIAWSAADMDGDAGWFDVSEGLALGASRAFRLELDVFIVFGGPW